MNILSWFRGLLERRGTFAAQLSGHTRSGQRVGPGAPSPRTSADARPLPAAALMGMIDSLSRHGALSATEAFNARVRVMGDES